MTPLDGNRGIIVNKSHISTAVGDTSMIRELYRNLSIIGGHQQFEEEFCGVVGAVGSFWMVQS
jgi:hypothetical protein